MADLPEDVREFIRGSVDSVEMLRVLGALRNDPARTWSVKELSDELRSSQSSIRSRLENLRALELVAESGGGFVYRAAPAKDALAARVLTAYRERRVSVIDMIFSQPSDPLVAFADAFRFGRRKQ